MAADRRGNLAAAFDPGGAEMKPEIQPRFIRQPRENIITLAQLKELLTYNSNTGEFIWKMHTGGKTKYGSIAGSKHYNGYILIKIHGLKYMAHRLAWFYIYNEWPIYIDHINRIRDDNRIINLRSVTSRQNHHNRGKNHNNKSGYKGVSICKGSKTRPWQAQIGHNNKIIHLGFYKTAIEASYAYKKAQNNLHECKPVENDK
jgi:hypothetical protein